MCEPVSITTALTLASTALAAGGTIYSGIQENNQAQYASAVATNNATSERNQAADAIERGNREQIKHARQVAALRANQVAAFAANGLNTSFGTPADAVADTNLLGAIDAQTIGENTGREARGFMVSAQNYDEESKAQKRAGRNALIKAGISATSTVIGGATQIAGRTPMQTASQRTAKNPFSGSQKLAFSL